jgi:hypothetical protein
MIGFNTREDAYRLGVVQNRSAPASKPIKATASNSLP